MGKPVVGEVVVVPFRFSDAGLGKKRPALVLADLPGDDIILCQVTSKKPGIDRFVCITEECFTEGKLPVDPSYVRPAKLFTADKKLVIRVVGKLKVNVMDEVKQELKATFDL